MYWYISQILPSNYDVYDAPLITRCTVTYALVQYPHGEFFKLMYPNRAMSL